jgi:hypothetical protein
MDQGKGSVTTSLQVEDVRQLLAETVSALPLDNKRVLVIIPDGTRTAPIPLLFRLLREHEPTCRVWLNGYSRCRIAYGTLSTIEGIGSWK